MSRARPVSGASTRSPSKSRRGWRSDPALIPRWLLLAGLVGSVAVFDMGTVKPFDVVKVTVLWVCVWLALGIWLVQVVRGRLESRWFHLATAAAAFIGAAGLATLLSVTPVVSFFGWYGRYNGFLQFLLWGAMFFLLVQVYRNRPERIGELLYAVGAGSVVLIAYIGIQYLGLDPIRWARPTGGEIAFPYFGTMGNSNFAGGYLGATSPWLVYAYLQARRPWLRGVVAAWATITLGALWLTSSRGGMVAASVALVVTVIVFRKRIRRLAGARRWIPRLVTATAVALVGIVTTVAVLVIWHPGSSEPPESLSDLRILRSQTLDVRTFWWGAALRIVAANPLLGTGPETYSVTYSRYVSPEAAGVRDAEIADKPHNVLLEHAASMGVLGVGSYLALLGLAAFWGLRRLRREGIRRGGDPVSGETSDGLGSRGDPQLDALRCFLALGAAYLGQATFSIDVAPLAIVGWVTLAGIAVTSDPRVVGASPPSPASHRSWRRLVAIGTIAVITLGVVMVGTRPWRADRAAKQAQLQAPRASASAVQALFDRAIALHPFEPTYRGMAGDFLVRRGTQVSDEEGRRALYRQALQRYEEMLALQPGHHLWMVSVGETLGLLGTVGSPERFPEADRRFAEAAELAPVDHRIPIRHGEMLNRWAQSVGDREIHCRAHASFQRALMLARRDARAWAGLGMTHAYLGRMDPAIESLERARRLDPGFPQIGRLVEEVERLRDADISVTRC